MLELMDLFGGAQQTEGVSDSPKEVGFACVYFAYYPYGRQRLIGSIKRHRRAFDSESPLFYPLFSKDNTKQSGRNKPCSLASDCTT